MILKRGIVVVFVALTLAAPVAADFEAGWDAYERGDYATALKEWLPLAAQGDVKAQFNLGIMYDTGVGLPRDYAEAVKWYRRAAEQGAADAQFNLGLMYFKGQGVPQDHVEAAKWYSLAAEQGDAEAQFALGAMYEHGWGVPQNHAGAVKWYRLAAEQGDAEAQNNLGIMYANGRGVARDYVQAHKWFNLAAARTPPGKLRGVAAANLDSIEQRMTPAQVAEARRLAWRWQPKMLLIRRENIAALQRMLARLGYDTGPVDGVAGPMTRNAIRAFQRDHDLTADSDPSRALLNRAAQEIGRQQASEGAND